MNLKDFLARARTLTTQPSLKALEKMPRWQRAVAAPARVAAAVVQDLWQGELTLRAMSLVYTTLLSLVPLLAISFSVLKAFGVHNQIEPILAETLEPLGARAEEISDRVIDFVDNIEVGVLGFVGFLLLFYTVVILLQKVERSFNYIWHIPGERRLSQKFRDYLSLVIMGPVLVFATTGVVASIMSSEIVQGLTEASVVSGLIEFVSRLTSLFLAVAAFTFVYAFMPYTSVKLRAALYGAVTAGVLWTIAGWGFALFIAGSTKYTVIYSAFATLILLLIWIYLAWLIVMIGNAVAFYVQNPDYVGVRREKARYSIALTETVAIAAAQCIARAWYKGDAPPTAGDLAAATGAPMPVIVRVIEALEKARLIERAGEAQEALFPARPPEETPLKAILDAVRRDEGSGHPPVRRFDPPERAAAIAARLDDALTKGLEGTTLKDLAMEQAEAAS